jgi:glycerophosphoryl diester phosphodiesterase
MDSEKPLFMQIPPRKAWLVGHRGAAGHAPENTMASFRKGLELGADFLECDVHLSKDGRCVVLHDESVDRTTDGRGLVRKQSSAELKKLDAGS